MAGPVDNIEEIKAKVAKLRAAKERRDHAGERYKEAAHIREEVRKALAEYDREFQVARRELDELTLPDGEPRE